jgi:hypothetical protein
MIKYGTGTGKSLKRMKSDEINLALFLKVENATKEQWGLLWWGITLLARSSISILLSKSHKLQLVGSVSFA